MINIFGYKWWELLSPFFKTEEWKDIVHLINTDRKQNIVIPEQGSNLFFKIFKDLQPDDIKVVILGQDPYCQSKNIYDGYAFSCSNTINPQPSLRNIIKEIERTFPDNLNLNRNDLSYLVKQGVFLCNTALSVILNKPDSHTNIWNKFTTFWIDVLSSYNQDIIWLLMGNKAHNFEIFINYGDILKTGHPSPLNTSNPFVTSDAFIKINEGLIKLNKQEINW